jgi:hypothetical protein
MAIIKIKTKTGATITIKGTESEVSELTPYFQKLIAGETKSDKGRIEKSKKRSTASELIIEMREKGYFDKPKSLREIVSALQEKGYIFKTTSLSGTMIDLVKRKMLGRKKIDKKWRYGK